MLNNMKKALAFAATIATIVGLMEQADDLSAEQKKKAAMESWNILEKTMGFDWEDKYVSIAIEVIYGLGKFTGTITSSASSTPAAPGK